MPSPPRTRWHAYETELRNVSIPVKASVAAGDITSAALSIVGLPDINLIATADAGGYKLGANGVTMPAPGVYEWTAKVVEQGIPGPLVVALGDLHVRDM
jgi:hypothetical protein